VGKDVVLLTSQGGQNLFIGNNPWNDNGRYAPPIFIRPNPEYEREDFHVWAEKNTGRELTPSEVSRYWSGRVFSYIAEKPGHWLRLMGTKFRLFWNWYEVPDNQNFYFFSRYSSLLRMPLFSFRVVAALGLTGMVLCLRQWRRLLLPYLIVILYSGTVIAFYIFARYKLPVIPMLLVFGAACLGTVYEMAVRKSYFRLGATAVLVGIFLVVLSMRVGAGGYPVDRANAFCRLGSIYLAEGKLDEAVSVYEQAAVIAPQYWAAYYGLGEAYQRQDKPDRALANFEKAAYFNPGNVDICVRLGHILFNEKRYEESIEQYERAVRLKPDWPEPHRWLANVYTIRGDGEKARVHLRKYREMKAQLLPAE
jgi:tetratricopeptide (TPR) repeat protein